MQGVVGQNDSSGLEGMIKKFPKGAKPLHRRFSKWGEARVDGSNESIVHHDLQGGLSDNSLVEIVDVGIPREPLDFCKRAIEVGHPRSVAIHLSGIVRKL